MDTSTTTAPDTALETLQFAISLFDSQAAFARAVERKPQDVWNWLHRDGKAPIDACPFIEHQCKHPKVTCELLRPDYEGWQLLRTSVEESATHGRRSSDKKVSA